MFEYTYDALHVSFVLNCAGDSRNESCRLSERRSETCSVTRANCEDTRASRDAMVPVAGKMLPGFTKIGRPASLASEKRCVGSKFRSMNPP